MFQILVSAAFLLFVFSEVFPRWNALSRSIGFFSRNHVPAFLNAGGRAGVEI